MSEDSNKRLNIVLPEQTMVRVENLKNMTDEASVTSVIRKAILTYEALAEYLSQGYKFYVKAPNQQSHTPIEFLIDIKVKDER
jgi:hypothetical protein